MNKACVSAAIAKIKALESDGRNIKFSKWSREECRRQAWRLRRAFNMEGFSL